jgi:hypothetical protein
MDVLGMWSSQVNIQNHLLHNYICITVGGVKVIGQSGSVLNGGDPKGNGACPLGGDPHGVDQYPRPICGGGGPLGWPGYDCRGKR